MNEVLLFVEIVVVFSLLLVSNKLFGKYGLIAWVGVASIVANVMLPKSISIFGFQTTLGSVMFASNYLATDVLTECYGKKDAQRAVYVGLFGLVIYLIGTQFALAFKASSIDIAGSSMLKLYSLAPRICISSVMMFFISNLLDVWMFDKLKEKTHGKYMWFRNNLCTIVCNCGENYLFNLAAFYGVYKLKDIFVMATIGSIVEMIIALCDTPFLYMAKYFYKKDNYGKRLISEVDN